MVHQSVRFLMPILYNKNVRFIFRLATNGSSCEIGYIIDDAKVSLDGLRNTREWLYRNRQLTNGGSSATSSSTDSVQAISTILVESFMELLRWNGEHPWPEVFI